MQTFRLNAPLSGLMLLSALLLSACGGGGGGGDGGGSGAPVAGTPATATACFNPARFVAGYTENQSYNLRAGTFSSSVVTETTVLGPAVFNGNAVVNSRSRTTTTFVGGPPSVEYSLTHDAINGASVVSHGSTTETSPGVVASTLTYSPPSVLRFDLTAGQSYTESVRETSSLASTAAVTRNSTVAFVGFEDVSVPAGVFRQACRFNLRETTSNSTENVSVDIWFARGDGVSLKAVSTDLNASNTPAISTIELVSVRINGRLVTP